MRKAAVIALLALVTSLTACQGVEDEVRQRAEDEVDRQSQRVEDRVNEEINERSTQAEDRIEQEVTQLLEDGEEGQ